MESEHKLKIDCKARLIFPLLFILSQIPHTELTFLEKKKNRVVLVVRQLLIWFMSTHMAICMSAFFWCSQLLNMQGNRGHMITRFILCFRMGQTLSEPVTTKDTSSCSNKLYKVGSSCMQGWRISILFVAGFSLTL